ncbi:hypothetical protein PG993_013507 [Apiospora rasikravindrae]|uniref:ubiquitinyl hydrolase 1 n=1 Tax=Apiospora rasikravindrae TaxID=990691 RepID=A0ABR1RXU5_9PEZI
MDNKQKAQRAHQRLIQSLFNHLAFPIQLPQQEDTIIPQLEAALVDRVIVASRRMQDYTHGDPVWQSIRHTLEATTKVTNPAGRLERTRLQSQLRHFAATEGGQFLILYIAAQNAAILLYKCSDKRSVVFEMFEASAKRQDVLASKGALQWDFPGVAVQVPLNLLTNEAFLESLAVFLEQASIEDTKNFEFITKAGAEVRENRETREPSIITSLLAALLEANGTRIAPKLLRKRVRDDVCWHNTEIPFRRLPYLLALKVALERHLSMVLGEELGRIHYKLLVSTLLELLLKESKGTTVTFENQSFLVTKLCRRLFKLEGDLTGASPDVQKLAGPLLKSVSASIRRTTQETTRQIDMTWQSEKRGRTKIIPPVLRRAKDSDLVLHMYSSRQYLEEACHRFRNVTPGPVRKTFESRKTMRRTQMQSMTETYFRLFKSEKAMVQSYNVLDPESQVLTLQELIEDYMSQVSSHYDEHVEQKSLMLLSIMQAWMELDKAACLEYPLLKDYHPLFPCRMLEVLHLPLLEDMIRARKIEQYIQERIHDCQNSYMTIFDDPVKGCFAERYYNESGESAELHDLMAAIEIAAEEGRQEKKRELDEKTEKYHKLSREIDETACLYIQDNYSNEALHHRHCSKCFLTRERQRLRIRVFEEPLPAGEVMKKAVVFELACPEAFAAYRDATWAIAVQFSVQIMESSPVPMKELKDYSELEEYHTSTGSISLASTTKSFLGTHYANQRFPVDQSQIFKPNALSYSYYDRTSKSWPGWKRLRPSFAHQCRLLLPKNTPFASLLDVSNFDNIGAGPSSYEIVGSQSSCPPGLNVHEYMAFQFLMSGKARRWVTLLTELASSSLNFSTESVVMLVSHVSLQLGPPSETSDPRGMAHSIFSDASFCDGLLNQVQLKLECIASNWRETNVMETILTVVLRLIQLIHKHDETAFAILDRTREVTILWIRKLRAETYQASDSKSAKNCQVYLLLAALLCKRACFKLLEAENPPVYVITAFFEACIAVHDNIPENVQDLPRMTRNHIVRDLRLMHGVRNKLRSLLTVSQGQNLVQSLLAAWPASESKEIETFELDGDEGVVLHLRDKQEQSFQVVNYNLVHGSLLVDGQPLGRLSTDEKSSMILAILFGNQSLMKFPSSSPGMSYTLCVEKDGWRTHIGYDQKGSTIIRITRQHFVLEYIPKEVFQRDNSIDLPASLVDDCIHWLNVKSRKMEIRPRASVWISQSRNWTLDMNNWTCSRGVPPSRKNPNGTRENLVDPYCDLFGRVARIFHGFEPRQHLTLYQPQNAVLMIDLKRMSIRFFVNKFQRLQSNQLRIEIDTNQDAGTWYGFDSKLVCMDPQDPNQRSILMPVGDLDVLKRGCHVQVTVKPATTTYMYYLKYSINETLGRLDCACEPAMIYKKAEVHAFTSCGYQPDPLTGRTGTEEALDLLASGVSQPWTSLGSLPIMCLESIARLSPRREWYPEDKRSMKREYWDARHPVTNQHDAFRPLVEVILQKSAKLGVFGPPKTTEVPESLLSNDPHLAKRALLRRQLHQRAVESLPQPRDAEDLQYRSRDTPSDTSVKYNNVYGIVETIKAKRPMMATVQNLAGALAQCASIQGYSEEFEHLSLGERLDIDICKLWGPLVNFIRESRCKYEVMFLLATVSFRFNAPTALIRTIAAFFLFEELKSLEYPLVSEYQNLRPGQLPTIESLVKAIEPFKAAGPEDLPLMEFASSKAKRQLFQARASHEQKANRECALFAEHLLRQWPCQDPTIDGLEGITLLDAQLALEAVLPDWQRIHENHVFVVHLEGVQKMLGARFAESANTRRSFVTHEVFARPVRQYGIPRLGQDLMMTAASRMLAEPDRIARSVISTFQNHNSASKKHNSDPTEHDSAIDELEKIIRRVDNPKSAIARGYAKDLRRSVRAMKSHNETVAALDVQTLPHISDCKEAVRTRFYSMDIMLRQPSRSMTLEQIQWLTQGRLWPIVTPITLLEQLRSTSKVSFGSGMKESLVNMGLSITALQRGKRIAKYERDNQHSRLEEERKNFGHTNWSPYEHTDWLLLEIESEILIRETQVDVARAIATPKAGNSVLQMNMGQGKTSCVIPMVATMLADTKNLVRVIVPKALLQQTAQLLSTSVGSLLGRQVRHIPFSRRTSTKEDTIKLYHSLHREIQKKSGIMLCVPEHNLSFMLSGQQRLLDQRVPEASVMLRTQGWLNATSRDIMDESDHILAVKTQLIYPSGSLYSVDGHPTRWLVIESLLALVDMHLYSLEKTFAHSVQVVRRPQGGFPLRIYLLRPDVGEELVRRLRNDIFQGRMSILPVESLDPQDKLAIREFLSGGKMRPQSIDRINKLCPDQLHIRQTVYLLRGLLCQRILISTLRKRWNVEYGLHPERDPIAVPYLAKGVPSEQSEYGHCDVAILLTCLSFYHGGLNESQTREAIEQVLKSDDPASLYEKWIDDRLPEYLRDWQSLNVDDPQQLSQIWACVRYRVPVIDYYLNTFVFPRHAKQFKVKIQSNGWDLPLPTSRSGVGENVRFSGTTGFSGTNDNKTLLPLNIKQEDLEPLSHTNAEVLTYLLQQRSRRYYKIADWKTGNRLSEVEFLQMLSKHHYRILIDAGASILEMSNYTLAITWLQVDSSASVALYFEGDKPMIVSKQGAKTPLLATPYADNLDEVLVYLDEVHTRGTDLKFAPNARAALTLGIGQTKDHTVQAAMRLRQLGTTQLVTFYAPPEVDRSIRDICRKKDHELIQSPDVLQWLMTNTCDSIEALQPLYYAQGTDYCRRQQAELDYPCFVDDDDERNEYISAIRQNERQTLQQLYGPQKKGKSMALTIRGGSSLAPYMRELEICRKGFQDTGAAVHASALQEVEQERETEYEIELVRQVKRPPPCPPHKFPGLHRDLDIYARTGRIPGGSDWFVPMFRALSRTGLGRKYKVHRDHVGFPLFLSGEFEKTVKVVMETYSDQFMRPVQWVLYSPSPESAVVVTPEEAEDLILMLRDGTCPTHLLTYAAPVTRRMVCFNSLKFYSIPSLPRSWTAPPDLVVELGLFAGRLYFDWDEYPSVCGLLGINESMVGNKEEFDFSTERETTSAAESSTEASVSVPAVDGTAESRITSHDPSSRHEPVGFTPKPFTFTREWLSVRRRGQDIAHSPMGFIASGKPLYADLPFFQRAWEGAGVTSSLFAPVSVGPVEPEAGILMHHDDEMDVGNYDAEAELRDDEVHEEIEYEEADKYQEGKKS